MLGLFFFKLLVDRLSLISDKLSQLSLIEVGVFDNLVMLTIELDSIPVHFWQTTIWNHDETKLIPAWQYWLETGYQSIAFLDLGEAIKAAKQEVTETNEHYDCLIMYPDYSDRSWKLSDCEF